MGFKKFLRNYLQEGGNTLSDNTLNNLDLKLKNDITELYSISEVIRQHGGYKKINDKIVLASLQFKYPETEYNNYVNNLQKKTIFNFWSSQTGGNILSNNEIKKVINSIFNNNNITNSGLNIINNVLSYNIHNIN